MWGGAGFTRDPGMEQIYRDARISTIYEGTTGVQALDLLGRKVLLNKGKFQRRFSKKIIEGAFHAAFQSPNASRLRGMALQVARHAVEWNVLSARLMLAAARNKDVVGSSSVSFLMYSGYVSMAHQWLRMADVALSKLRTSGLADADVAHLTAKVELAEFYFAHLLPRTRTLRTTMLASPRTLMQMHADKF